MKFCNHDEKPLEKVKAADGGAFRGFTASKGCSRPDFEGKMALTWKICISEPMLVKSK